MFALVLLLIAANSADCFNVGEPCSTDGYLRDPSNCQIYANCSDGQIFRVLRCPIGLYFDENNQTCTVGPTSDCLIDVLIDGGDDHIHVKSMLSAQLAPDELESLANEYVRQPKYKVVCYFPNWAWTSPGAGSYYPEDIQAHLCTHINYAFASLDKKTLELTSPNTTVDFNMNFFRRIVDLKQINPKLKVLLSIGGWGEDSDKYSRMVNSPKSRRNFIEKAVQFVTENGFDGLDLDWEYPRCWRGDCSAGPAQDKQSFGELVQELREYTDNRSSDQRFLITAAVSGFPGLVEPSYDVTKLSQYLDFVNLMTYDLYHGYRGQAVHHSQLFDIPDGARFGDKQRDCNATVTRWLQGGMPSEKLVLGVPFYGRAFTLSGNSSNLPNHGLGQLSIGPGKAGPLTREAGYISFTEICLQLLNQGWERFRFADSSEPIAYRGDQFVGYDDVESLARKAAYIKDMGLGGAMLWELSLDDFRGSCCSEAHPLLKTLNKELLGIGNHEKIICP